MLVGVRVGVGLTRSTISSVAPIYICHHVIEKNCPNGSEPPMVGTGYHRLYPKWRILPARPATSHRPNKSSASDLMITIDDAGSTRPG